MKSPLFTLSLAFLFSSISYCHACSCQHLHPQAHYCMSDFVILAKVKKEQPILSTQTKVYKVRVKKTFKISEKGLVALKSGKLHSALDGSMCGAQIHVGGLYVLSGRIHSLRAHITLCDMFTPWHEVNKRQRKGLRLLYKHGCDCGIKECRSTCHIRNKDNCNWSSRCEMDYGICSRQENGSCMWNKNKMMGFCKRNETSVRTKPHKHNRPPRLPLMEFEP